MAIEPLPMRYFSLVKDVDFLEVEWIARFLLFASGGIINR